MAGPINKSSILLSGGIDERSASELASPVASPGTPITLRTSENTRLSPSKGTCTRAPAATNGGSGVGTGQRIRSITSSAAGKASLALMVPGYNERIGEDGTLTGAGSGYYPSTPGATPGDSFLPGNITESGSCPNAPSTSRISSAVVVDSFSGSQYIYHVFTNLLAPNSYSVSAYITDLNGALIATPRIVVPSTTMLTGEVAITTHLSGQVNVWYDNAANVATFTLTHSGNNQLAASAPVVTTIVGLSRKIAVTSGFYLNYAGTPVTTYARYAYLVVALAGNPVLYRVDTAAAYAVTSVATVADVYSFPTWDVAFHLGTVAVAYQSDTFVAVNTYTSALVPVTVASAASSPAGLDGGGVSCHFLSEGGVTSVIALFSTGSLPDTLATEVYSASTTVNTITKIDTLPWMAPVSAGSQITVRSGAGTDFYYPVFELVRNYGRYSYDPTNDQYVSDPDVQLWICRNTSGIAAAARYGTLRGTAAPASVILAGAGVFAGMNGPLFLGDAQMYTTYRKEDISATDVDLRRTSRWLKLDFSPTQFRGAADRDGSTLVAAALPFEWDSVSPAELGGPLYAPKITEAQTTASGPWPDGEYVIAAVYTWIDGAGKKHRSSPGQVLVELVGEAINYIKVAAPAAHLKGGNSVIPTSPPFECELYISTATSTTPTRQAVSTTYDQFGWSFFPTTSPTDDGAQIYSTGTAGEEQTPQAPCPLSDITIIGDRAWGIDAEMPSRIVHSKRRVAGIGYEWYPGYEVLLPSGAGDALAIREWQGAVVVLTELAIFVVSGDGPDNLVGNPSGGGFSKPQKVSDLGTSVAASVISTPVGIAFQRDQDMMLFTGGAPSDLPGPVLETSCTGVALFRDQDEAVFFFSDRQLVWNYGAQRFTTWTLKNAASATMNVQAVAPLTYDQDRMMLVDRASTVDTVYVLASGTPSTLPMSWETDWLVLGGDFQDHVILQHLVFSARRGGVHGLTIDILTNYDAVTPSTTVSYTNAELAALALGSPGRYTVKIQPRDRGTRAVKIRVSETAPDTLGMVPISLTLYHSLEANLFEPGIRPGSFK